jgi:hypothetical protein
LAALLVIGLLSLGLLSLCGCGGVSLPPLNPVKGKVTVEGQPLTGGNISLIPVAVTNDKTIPPSAGEIKSSGEYEIFTGGKSGAPAGDYKVVITPPMMPMDMAAGQKGPPKLPFNMKYGNPKDTPLQVKVPGGDYDLTLKK